MPKRQQTSATDEATRRHKNPDPGAGMIIAAGAIFIM